LVDSKSSSGVAQHGKGTHKITTTRRISRVVVVVDDKTTTVQVFKAKGEEEERPCLCFYGYVFFPYFS
jgi:hypothetical protein